LHSSTWTGDRSVGFIRRHRDRPFFLWASFIDPHPPLCPPAPYCDMYDPREMPLPVRRSGEIDDKPPHFRGLGDPQGVARRPYGPPRDVVDEQRPDFHNQVRKALYYGMVSLVDHNV